MKVRLSHVCNSSSSDFIATMTACLCYGTGTEKLPYYVRVPFTEDLDQIKEGEIVTLENTKEGWKKDFKLVKISSKADADSDVDRNTVFFFFQELDSSGEPIFKEV